MKKESLLRIAIFIGIVWTLIFHFAEDFLPKVIWGFITATLVIYMFPKWLSRE